MAAGEQVQGAAPRVHQQDGPPGRGLLQVLWAHQDALEGQPRADPDSDRRRGEIRGRHRPGAHEGDLLGRFHARDEVRDARNPRGPSRTGQGMAREDGRSRRRGERRSDAQVSRGPRPLERGHQARPAHPHRQERDRADAVRLGVQEQGRAGDARRRGRLPAGADRHPARQGPGRGRQARCAQGGGRRAFRRARVQDHDRPLRGAAHVLPRLFRRAQFGGHGLHLGARQEGAHRAPAADARKPARRDQGSARRRYRRGRRPEGCHDG